MNTGSSASRLNDCRILVTGGSGFVGRHLTACLLQQGHGDSAPKVIRAGRPGEAVDLAFDLNDPRSIEEAIGEASPDVVFHLAGEASVAHAAQAAADTWRVNLGGSLALASALGRAAPHATMLFTSSSEVYGRAFLDGAASEDTLPRPVSVYAQSKLATEQMLAAVLPATATLLVVRPSNHIGPGQNGQFVLPSFATQLAAGEREGRSPIIRVGNLDACRDFMDVRDVVRAYIDLAGRFHRSGRRETFNVASGVARSIRSLLDDLRAEARIDSTVEIDPARLRPSEIPAAVVDASRLHALTGWSTRVPLEQSLRDVLADARQRLAIG